MTNEEITDSANPIWYFPHFGVVSPHKKKMLRIVFDGAAKVKDMSLNLALVKGLEEAKPLLGI